MDGVPAVLPASLKSAVLAAAAFLLLLLMMMMVMVVVVVLLLLLLLSVTINRSSDDGKHGWAALQVGVDVEDEF